MSETPKTDRWEWEQECNYDVPWEEHCRELERENAALLDVLESMANQHCRTAAAHRDYNGQLAGTLVTDSGALTANGKALHVLANANPPRFRIVAEIGRMVVGYWPENDPEKHPRTNPVSQ